jgi:hypothetical protein
MTPLAMHACAHGTVGIIVIFDAQKNSYDGELSRPFFVRQNVETK